MPLIWFQTHCEGGLVRFPFDTARSPFLRTWLRRAGTALLAAALSLAGGACGRVSGTSNPRSAAVSDKGGQYTLGGITVTVPAGSVRNGTKLSVSVPTASAADDGS